MGFSKRLRLSMMNRVVKIFTDFDQITVPSHLLLKALLLVVLTVILTILSSMMHLTVGFNEQAPDVYNWVKDAYFLGKRPQMFFFMASIPTIFLFITSYQIFVADWLSSKLKTEQVKPTVLLDFLIIGGILAKLSHQVSFKIATLLNYNTALLYLVAQFIILLMIPLIFFSLHLKGKDYICAFCWQLISKLYDSTRTLTGLIFIVGFMLLAQSYVYFPLATNSLSFVNEYLNIPSKLSKQIAGTTNSIDAINSFPQSSMHITTMTHPTDAIVRPTLSVLGKNQKDAETFALNNNNLYYYDFFLNTLVAMAPIPNSDVLQLQKATGASLEVIRKFVKSTEEREKLKSLTLQKDDKTNLEALRFNLHWQILSRWYFHHHNFVWGPILKLSTGMNLKSIFFQYGITGGAVQYGFAKYLLGGFNIPNYFLQWSILYGIYFILFHIGVYFITKSKQLTIISSVFFVAFLLSQQYEYIFLGPGLNPIRHFLDIPAFVFAYRFFTTRSKSSFLGFISLILLNFILNPEFGMFCSGALLFSVVIYMWVNKIFDKYLLGVGAVTIVLHAFLWFFLKTGQEAAVGLYLGGFFSPVYSTRILFVSLLALSGFTTLLIVRTSPLRTMRAEGFILLAALLYCSVIFLYPLFGMTWNHIVNISPIIVFTAIIAINYLLHHYTELTKPLVIILMTFSVLFFTNSAKYFFKTKATYQDELANYTNEKWQLKGNPLLTQIPEKPIADSIHLIEKYAKANSPLTMISRFDNLLPLLGQKSVALPGNELMTFLFSDAEYKKVISAFDKQKPKILFTDRDILMPSIDELIDQNAQVIGYLHGESKMRLERVNRIKIIFGEIKMNYKKIDEGGLLTVWERI